MPAFLQVPDAVPKSASHRPGTRSARLGPDPGSLFGGLLEDAGIGDMPGDWRERVRIGSDREQSGTARENLAGGIPELPDELPPVQKQLVDYAAPGLREVLGYPRNG